MAKLIAALKAGPDPKFDPEFVTPEDEHPDNEPEGSAS